MTTGESLTTIEQSDSSISTTSPAKDSPASKTTSSAGVLCILGVGGMGNSDIPRVASKLSPNSFPDVYWAGANTDRAHLNERIRNATGELIEKWKAEGRLEAVEIGTKLTEGLGAGTDPIIGRKAAQESKKVLTRFIKRGSQLLIICGLGKGTGTGAGPEIAVLTMSLGKTVLMIVTMPDLSEGKKRRKKAERALRLIERRRIPHIVVQNEYLTELRKAMPEGGKALSLEDSWAMVSEQCTMPVVESTIEMLQPKAGASQFDEADRRNFFKKGHHVFFGRVDLETGKKPEDLEIEVLVKDLFASRFQKTEIIEHGEEAALQAHGPWPAGLLNEVLAKIGERVCRGQPNKEIEVYLGNMDKVTDDKMWLAVYVVAKDLKPRPVVEVATEPAQAVLASPAPEQIAVVEEAKPKPLRRIPVPVSYRITPAPPLVKVGPLVEAFASHASIGSNGDSPDIELPTFIRK